MSNASGLVRCAIETSSGDEGEILVGLEDDVADAGQTSSA